MRSVRRLSFLVALMWLPLGAVAHPLGNFTTNQYVGVHLTQDMVVVDYVLDLAEIPASQVRRDIDADGEGDVSEEEAASFEESECEAAAADLDVTVDGSAAPLTVDGSALTFPGGEAGLPTLRLECRLVSDDGIGGPTAVTVGNDRYADRQGWRELVVTGDGVSIDTDLPEVSATDRLRGYPEDRLSSPVDVTEGTIAVRPDDSATVGTPPPMPGSSAAETRSTPVDALASLVDPQRGSPALPVAMAVAVGLGILHALAPGHGKTVMAAYLMGSQGTLGQAVGLGVAVAASHTVGVFVLGLLTLAGTTAFAPERVFPVLSTLSGIIVMGIGVWMLARWIRARPGVDEHRVDEHRHESDHDSDTHSDSAGEGAHVHSHGGRAHSHAVPAGLEGASGWKVLASMGLAGGLVPSTSAVVLLLASVNLGRVPLGMLLIALFGVGMATTLVGVGLGLVKVGEASMDRWGNTGWVRTARRLLTPVAATVVIVVGLFLTVGAT